MRAMRKRTGTITIENCKKVFFVSYGIVEGEGVCSYCANAWVSGEAAGDKSMQDCSGKLTDHCLAVLAAFGQANKCLYVKPNSDVSVSLSSPLGTESSPEANAHLWSTMPRPKG